MNIVVFICTILGAIAAIYGIMAYRKDHIEKPKEQKNALEVKFFMNQRLATGIRENLIQYAKQNNAYDLQFFQGVTFSSYINLLTKTLSYDLSDETFEKIKKEKLTEPIINSMSESLDEQCKNFLQVKNYFNLYFYSK